MIVSAVRAVDVTLFAFEIGFDFLARHGAFGHFGLGEEEVDDLVLI